MNKARKYLRLFLLTILFSMSSIFLVNVQADGLGTVTLKPSAKTLKNVKVTASWGKSKGAGQYRIYRSKAFKKEVDYLSGSVNFGFKKIATLKSKTRKYTDKKLTYGRWYVYKVAAYKKVKGKYKLLESSLMNVYTGPDQVQWDDYQYADGYISPKRIDLTFWRCGIGLKCSGVEIYRKAPGEKYKKLTTLNAAGVKYDFKYKDKSVKAGTRYTYKARAFLKLSGKKRYSAWTEEMNLRAVNQAGVYTGKYLNPAFGTEVTEILVSMKADKNNALLQLNSSFSYMVDDLNDIIFEASYSTDDQKTWTKVSEDPLQLPAGEEVVLRFTPVKWISGEGDADGHYENISFTVPKDGFWLETFDTIRYNDLPCRCTVTLYAGQPASMSAYVDAESVH